MIIGCISDDFTGGSDIASFFEKGGLSTALINGIPNKKIDLSVDVCVIALKTRTMKKEKAVKQSIQALNWLKEQGANQFYIKYCSTFDSTPEGNIGPICDAALEELKVPYTIVAPSLPVNGRIVKDGCLYVHGVPLNESSMKSHPLTPMWESDLSKLLKVQSKYPNIKIKINAESLQSRVENFIQHQKSFFESEHIYVIPDFTDEEDAIALTKTFGHLTLLTGGSGLAESLAKKYQSKTIKKVKYSSDAPAIILAGSASEKTLEQIEYFKNKGGLFYFVNVEKVLEGKESINHILDYIKDNKNESILIYISDTPERIKQIQRQFRKEISTILENFIAKIAKGAYEMGYEKFIIAGGETSGAVAKELGFQAYEIGTSIEPGVPVLIPYLNNEVRLVFKSGNFGKRDFYFKALSLM